MYSLNTSWIIKHPSKSVWLHLLATSWSKSSKMPINPVYSHWAFPPKTSRFLKKWTWQRTRKSNRFWAIFRICLPIRFSLWLHIRYQDLIKPSESAALRMLAPRSGKAKAHSAPQVYLTIFTLHTPKKEELLEIFLCKLQKYMRPFWIRLQTVIKIHPIGSPQAINTKLLTAQAPIKAVSINTKTWATRLCGIWAEWSSSICFNIHYSAQKCAWPSKTRRWLSS